MQDTGDSVTNKYSWFHPHGTMGIIGEETVNKYMPTSCDKCMKEKGFEGSVGQRTNAHSISRWTLGPWRIELALV